MRPDDVPERRERPDDTVPGIDRLYVGRLAPLRAKLRPHHETFDIHAFRAQPHDPALRD